MCQLTKKLFWLVIRQISILHFTVFISYFDFLGCFLAVTYFHIHQIDPLSFSRCVIFIFWCGLWVLRITYDSSSYTNDTGMGVVAFVKVALTFLLTNAGCCWCGPLTPHRVDDFNMKLIFHFSLLTSANIFEYREFYIQFQSEQTFAFAQFNTRVFARIS